MTRRRRFLSGKLFLSECSLLPSQLMAICGLRVWRIHYLVQRASEFFFASVESQVFCKLLATSSWPGSL
jgi:hypothetical protein